MTLRDNGLGVDAAQATRIFSMFSRANEQTDGAGIGLAVCRRIIEAHGGRIWVEPADTGGARSGSRFHADGAGSPARAERVALPSDRERTLGRWGRRASTPSLTQQRGLA